MKNFKMVVVLGVCFASTFSAFAGNQKPQRMIAAFDKSSKGKDFRAVPPHYIDKEVVRDSPDGKYAARLTMGEGETASLTIYRKHAGKNHFQKKYAVSRQIDSVEGCVWVPGHSHWIAFSTNQAYGEPSMGIWTGAKKIRWLRRYTLVGGYNIRGVSADGRTLIYEAFGPHSPDPKYQRKGNLYLRLPRS